MFLKEYLVGANESSSESSKNFNNSWAAVASDSVVGSNLGHVGSPASMLPHYNSQVCYKECTLLRLRMKETLMIMSKKNKHCKILLKHSCK